MSAKQLKIRRKKQKGEFPYKIIATLAAILSVNVAAGKRVIQAGGKKVKTSQDF